MIEKAKWHCTRRFATKASSTFMPAHHRVLKGTQVSYRRSRLEPKPLSVKHQLLPTSFCQIPRPNEKSVSNAPPVSITNFRTIGSYSWAAESRGLGTCTIAVPGAC